MGILELYKIKAFPINMITKIDPIMIAFTIHVDPKNKAIAVIDRVSSSINPAPKKKRFVYFKSRGALPTLTNATTVNAKIVAST
jgi:hypothetical protein